MPKVKARESLPEFEPVSKGEHVLVLAEDADAGYEESNRWGEPEHKGILIFQADERFDEGARAGKRKEVWFRYNALKGLGSGPDFPTHLRIVLEGWRGKPFTEDELERLTEEEFDPGTLVGKCLVASVIHKTSKTTGRTRAEIVPDTVRPCPKDRRIEVEDYVPWAERQDDGGGDTSFPGPDVAGDEADDDDFVI